MLGHGREPEEVSADALGIGGLFNQLRDAMVVADDAGRIVPNSCDWDGSAGSGPLRPLPDGPSRWREARPALHRLRPPAF
jgi:hypothetical protein